MSKSTSTCETNTKQQNVRKVSQYISLYNILMMKLQSVNGKHVDKVVYCVVCREDCIGRQ